MCASCWKTIAILIGPGFSLWRHAISKVFNQGITAKLTDFSRWFLLSCSGWRIDDCTRWNVTVCCHIASSGSFFHLFQALFPTMFERTKWARSALRWLIASTSPTRTLFLGCTVPNLNLIFAAAPPKDLESAKRNGFGRDAWAAQLRTQTDALWTNFKIVRAND